MSPAHAPRRKLLQTPSPVSASATPRRPRISEKKVKGAIEKTPRKAKNTLCSRPFPLPYPVREGNICSGMGNQGLQPINPVCARPRSFKLILTLTMLNLGLGPGSEHRD